MFGKKLILCESHKIVNFEFFCDTILLLSYENLSV